MPSHIIIVDFGMGNLNSVKKKLSKFDCTPLISSDPKDIERADKLVLPGVGHFKKAMENLKEYRLLDVLNEAAHVSRKPILGICLGMQLMTTKSEEGAAEGLGWVEGEVVKFRTQNPLKFKIPHIGWNQISISKPSPLFKSIPELSEFYFIHSYYVKVKNPADTLNKSEYEHSFVSAFERGNIMGVQYHPEKSHDIGETLLSNFAAL